MAIRTPQPTGTGDVRTLIRKLLAGEVKWQSLPQETREAIVRFVGTDPSADPEGFRAAAESAAAGGEGTGGAPVAEPIDLSGLTAAAGQLGFHEQVLMNHRFALNEMYMSLWGEPAPVGWVKDAFNSGKNLFELEFEERQKPAFMETRTARDEAASYAHEIASALGMR